VNYDQFSFSVRSVIFEITIKEIKCYWKSVFVLAFRREKLGNFFILCYSLSSGEHKSIANPLAGNYKNTKYSRNGRGKFAGNICVLAVYMYISIRRDGAFSAREITLKFMKRAGMRR
jgi:hypothetical protein